MNDYELLDQHQLRLKSLLSNDAMDAETEEALRFAINSISAVKTLLQKMESRDVRKLDHVKEILFKFLQIGE